MNGSAGAGRPHRLSPTLAEIRDQLRPPTPLAAILEVWGEVVGEGVAAKAQPVSERDGVLTVACAAATWAQELDLLQREIAAGLRRKLGDEAPERLRFVVGDERYSDRD